MVPVIARLPVPPPFFLRKLNRAAHWGEQNTPLDRRARDIIRTVFPGGSEGVSLFWIQGDIDYRRAVMALCSGRGKPTGDKFSFVVVTAPELAAAGVAVQQTAGGTLCGFANTQLHFDATASDDCFFQLCITLLQSERVCQTLTPKELTLWMEAVKQEGCRSDKTTALCRVPCDEVSVG